MIDLPSGTVTFVFTDVAQSTELVKKLQESYIEALAAHGALLRAAFAEHGGVEVDTQGDAFFVAFGRASDAVEGAAAAQRELAKQASPEGVAVAVRVGIHTGEPYRSEHGYTGLAVNRAARICTMGHGGQVLLSGATAGIVEDVVIAGVSLRDLGEYRLKDFDRPERLFQLVIAGLPSDFSPLRAIDQQPPLSGTVTIVMTEGRRMMRLVRELPREHFETLITEYRRLVSQVLTEAGGRRVEMAADSVAAGFATAREGIVGAVAAQRAVATHEWPYGVSAAISVGVHSGEAGIGLLGPASLRCEELCDAAEGGQVFLSHATASLLEDESLGELMIRDVGEREMRRTRGAVRAYELVFPTTGESADS
jgi:class 3 adenylate cyclase